jgi:hypothetical protein
VDLVRLVSNNDQRLDQNVLRNLLFRYEVMVCGIPKWTDTRSKKILAVSTAVILFLQTVIMTIFENRSTTTNTQSLLFLVDERPDM